MVDLPPMASNLLPFHHLLYGDPMKIIGKSGSYILHEVVIEVHSIAYMTFCRSRALHSNCRQIDCTC